MGLGSVVVARKHPKSGAGGPSRKGPGPQPRETLIAIKGNPEWKLWLDRLASFDRSSTVQLIDRAIARYAKEIGFKEEPPER
jgi:hypothetical protein